MAPPDTLERARAVLGPFLPLFATGNPGPAVAATVEEMTAWLTAEESVRAWVAQYAPEAAEATEPAEAAEVTGAGGAVTAAAAHALAGAVLAWAQLHGSVSLEVAGQFAGMAHRGGTLLGAQMELLADAFGLE